jgi:ribosome biogenesis GTPase A
MEVYMNYQWYPGHMTKARRMMEENIKLIDLVIEVVDARIPLSSRNPDIDTLAANKARMLLLNKVDLASDKYNDEWVRYYQDKGFYVLKVNSRGGNGIKSVTPMILEACREKIERDKRKGIKNRPVRCMVVGIPNVGKSTFINSIVGKACTKTGNKPGVTKGKQWITLSKSVELLDTPGILWPRFDDQQTGRNLAFIGSMNDEVLNVDELACDLIGFLKENYAGSVMGRYGIEGEDKPAAMVLQDIAVARGAIRKGGEPDVSKAAALLMDDFRAGRLGRVTLELPEV